MNLRKTKRKILTEEHKKKLSEAQGGKKHTEETKKKIGLGNKGKKRSEEIRKKISERMKEKKYRLGKKHKHSEETKKKMSESQKEHKVSKKTKRKISEALKNKRKSEEHKRKISLALRGENNPSWLGGKSFEPYSPVWTKELKQTIRQRDNFICQLCGIYPIFNCHHIDYNKKNCEPDNLIILCGSCHSKTNQNRNYWINYFGKTIAVG